MRGKWDFSVHGAEIRVITNCEIKETALKKKSAFLSGNEHQPLSDMESSCEKIKTKKNQNRGTAAWHWVYRDFPVTFPKEKTEGRKEEPKGNVAMEQNVAKRTNPWSHIFTTGKEVFISSTRAQQEPTETWFNKTLILKTRIYQRFVCPLWGYTAKLTLADQADTKGRTCEGKKILISWAMIQ